MGKLSMFQWLNLTKTMESHELPQAPETLRHGKVKLVFHQITEGNKEKGFIPGYHFKIFNDQAEEVGQLNFRVGETTHVKFAAGHIGYEITPKHRGNRYATDACLALAPWVAEVSASVLITVDPNNIASIKTIESIGATYLDEVDVPEGDPHYLRGSLRKKRYVWEPLR